MALDRYAALPGWRRPLLVSPAFEREERSVRERMSLREAVYGVASDTPESAEYLRAAVREDWGAASDGAIDRERDELVRDGELERVPGGWVRVERDEDEDGAA